MLYFGAYSMIGSMIIAIPTKKRTNVSTTRKGDQASLAYETSKKIIDHFSTHKRT